MSNTMNTAKLPAAVAGKLRAIRRRQILLTLVRGLGVGASLLIAAMVLAMAIDWSVTLFDTRLRTLLSVGCLLLAAAGLLLATVPALIRVKRWMQAAGDADGVVPQLEERWTTIANFAQSGHQPDTAAGRAMLEQVTSEASAMEQLVDPRQVARPAALKPVALVLIVCLLGLVAFLAINWPQTSILLARFWSPQSDITATQLACESGDITIPRGETIELASKQSGIIRAAATLELQYSSDISDTLELTAAQDDSTMFVHSLRADSVFRYRMRAGDGQTPWHSVTVVDYPALDEVRLTITAPEYVDRPPYEKPLIPGRVKVVQGSLLDLQMKPIADVERLELALVIEQEQGQSIEETVTLTSDVDGWYRYQTQLLADMTLRPVLWNEHGLTNEQSATCSIQVVADKPPVARVVSPTDEMAVAVDDTIEIEFEAHDDFGIATAELVIYDESATEEGEPPKVLAVQPIPLGDQQLQQHILGSTQLNLEELGLAEGTQISYAVRVTDNRSVAADRSMAMAQADSRSDKSSSPEDTAAGRDISRDAESAQSARTSAASMSATSEGDDLDQMLADAGHASRQAARENSTEGAATESPADVSSDSTTATEQQAAAAGSAERRGNDPQIGTAATQANVSPDTTSPSARAAVPASNDSSVEHTNSATSPDSSQHTASEVADGAPAASATVKDTSREIPDATTEGPGEAAEDPSGVAVAESKPSPRMADATKSSASEQAEASDMPPDDTNDPKFASSSATPEGTVSSDLPAGETPLSQATGESTVASRDDSENADQPFTAASDLGTKRPTAPETSAETAIADQSSEQQMAHDNAETSETAEGSPNGDGRSRPRATGSQSPPPLVAMTAQQSVSGQDTETNRRKLKITARLTAVATASADREAQTMELRERVVAIDRMLAEVEHGITSVLERRIPDADHNEQYRRSDVQLGEIEEYIAALREETRDQEYAFVGLQMVDIGRTHVTPARDEIFVAVRDAAGAVRNAGDALQHVVRARELLDDLLKRYDRVTRDRKLAEALEETVEMYEVYVEKRHQLMREARQNKNPLQRKMSVIQVDQEYLDRFAEVLMLRREMLAEFARMLADDPRLLARYLDQLKRRRSSLRDQLAELSERQYEHATELSGWLAVNEAQRDNLWRLIAELRLQATTDLAGDSAELAERIEKQLPLSLDPNAGTAARVLDQTREIARLSRDISFAARGVIQNPSEADSETSLSSTADRLAHQFEQLDAALDQLNFEHESDADVSSYVSSRLLESRTVADQADRWARVCHSLDHQQYAGLALVDQQTTAVATELLRVEMLDFENDLETQFQQVAEADVPGEIVDLVRQLHGVMEQIAYNQAATMFALNRDALESAQRRQAAAVAGFDEAEQLFDRIRRAVIAALDEYDEDDPNIADLDDPTLDEFLARLEREPNIQAQLGIPNRPRNLRVIADTMANTPAGGPFLGDSEDAARRRAKEAMKMLRPRETKPPAPEEMTEQERQQRAQEQQMQEQLEKSLAALQQKLEDSEISEQQRRQLEQMAENMQRMLKQMGSSDRDAQAWRRIAESDQAKAILEALASGEAIPDQQWNKILSTLDDGLWQVRGRTPPEEYRRAIEQYQDRIRELMDTITGEAG